MNIIKICPRCGSPERNKFGRCLPCQNSATKRYRSKDPELHRQRCRARNKKHRAENPEMYVRYEKKIKDRQTNNYNSWKATLSCKKCGESHPHCLDFHHVGPSKKEFTLTARRFGSVKFSEELSKTVVLCANCHRKEHTRLKSEGIKAA